MQIPNVISNIGSKAYEYGLKKPFLYLSNTPMMDKGYAAYRNNRRGVIDGIGIASIVLKDGLGCWMYVHQSLNNDKIPEDKRKFVAALDLANGGLMIIAQILMHITISNKIVQSKMFNKMFGSKVDRNAQKMIQAILKNSDKYKNASSREITEICNKFKGSACDAFGSLTSLIAATTIGKRIIVPFIATPLAGKVEAHMNKNKKEAQIDVETANNYNSDKHALHDESKKKHDVLNATVDRVNTAGNNLLNKFKAHN